MDTTSLHMLAIQSILLICFAGITNDILLHIQFDLLPTVTPLP